ncbi:uncharacterized protein LOC144631525 [Oculina patagonica]
MFCLVRLLCFILLCVLVESNQQSRASTSYQCGCHGRDGRDGRDGLNGRDGVKGDKGDQGREGKKGEPGICDIKELTAIKSKLKELKQEVERLRNQTKPTPCDRDCKQGLHFFEKFQDIPTKGAADVKSFSIGDDLFLVFANNHGDKLNHKAESVVYKMEHGRFVQNQTLSTHGAYGIEHFVIDKVHYMAIANHYDGGYKLNSVVYKWSGDQFVQFQLISTNGASGFNFFTIKGEHYLAVSEYHDGSTQSIDSFVYKWKKGRFVKYQNIPTNGAMACDSIEIANETYLVYANHYHPKKKYNIESNVYKWSGGHFLKSQTIQTQGAHGAKFFHVSGHVFLAFANYYTGSNYNTKSPIYKWDGAKFTLFQEIPTRGAMELCPFEVNGEKFLAIANHHGDSAGYSVRSVVYKASGAQFTLYQDFQTFGGYGVDAIVDKGQRYLVFANYYKSKYNIDSSVYKFV